MSGTLGDAKAIVFPTGVGMNRIPFSYTHLEVYKRQDEATALVKANDLAEGLAKLDKDAAKKNKLQTKTLCFTSRSELEALAAIAVNNENIKKHAKTFAQSLCTDAADIALFGRMVASAPELTLEGAAMFSHALSTCLLYTSRCV